MSSQISVRVHVNTLVYDLIGEISSSDEDTNDVDALELYLLSDYQGMARTKNTLRTTSNPPNPFLSAGGHQIATRSSQTLDNMAGTTRSGATFNLPSLGSSEDDLDSGGSSRSKRGHPDRGGGGSPSKRSRAGPNPPPIPMKNIR